MLAVWQKAVPGLTSLLLYRRWNAGGVQALNKDGGRRADRDAHYEATPVAVLRHRCYSASVLIPVYTQTLNQLI